MRSAIRTRWLACGLLLACTGAQAQPACPQGTDVASAQLFGLWRAEFGGSWHVATLLLEAHPEYPGSLAGAINRNGERARVAGDLEDGEFTLEESEDGVRISASWTGSLAPGSCGREIRGTWQATGGAATRSFVLRKQ